MISVIDNIVESIKCEENMSQKLYQIPMLKKYVIMLLCL